jgi:hypothetical protein
MTDKKQNEQQAELRDLDVPAGAAQEVKPYLSANHNETLARGYVANNHNLTLVRGACSYWV